jgi:hypothetical protein
MMWCVFLTMSECSGRVPIKYDQDPKLGRWVSLQRSQYKDYLSGSKTSLTKERIQLLQDIGFEWRVSLKRG